MNTSVLVTTILTALVRRGVTWLGLSGQIADNEIVQIAGWLLVGGNEAVQIWKAHQAATDQRSRVRVRP